MSNKNQFLLDSKNFFLIDLEKDYIIEDCLKTDLNIGGTYFVFKNNSLKGLFTDRDIRNSNYELKTKIINAIHLWEKDIIVLNKKEINNLEAFEILNLIKKKCKEFKRKRYPNHIPIVNEQNKLDKVIDFNKLSNLSSFQKDSISSISVIGLGYVGLTLAITLADKGFEVEGLDINKKIINKLKDCKTHILEPGIENYLKRLKETKKLKFNLVENINYSDAFVIAVGTDVINEKLDDKALKGAIQSIAKVYDENSHIFLRSTVPVGTTRSLISYFKELRPDLDEEQINVSFTPERTVEGDAFDEIKNIPQIIGSNNEVSLAKAEKLWNKIALSSLLCKSLEEAELVKLINNSYRDLRFTFANQIGIMCEKYSINTHNLISKANSGYPRDPIAYPSPGVGGYCLTKDPLLLNQSFKECKSLSSLARDINKEATFAPLRAVKNWTKKNNLDIKNLKILIVGLAFKGYPSTKDTRCSTSLDVISKLIELNVNQIYIFDGADATLPSGFDSTKITNLGAKIMNKKDFAVSKINVVLILNNHISNKLIEFSSFISEVNYRVMLFDGWNQLEVLKGLNLTNLDYRTIGEV